MKHAADFSQVAIVKALLASGADVHTKGNKGWTALQGASDRGHSAVVEALLDGGADVRAKTDAGWTALHCAGALAATLPSSRHCSPAARISMQKTVWGGRPCTAPSAMATVAPTSMPRITREGI